jgi:thymidylate synthase
MKQYHDIFDRSWEHGTAHQDRTGVGTISHFGYQTRFDLRAGVPDCDHQASSLSLGRRRTVLVSFR